MRPIVNITLAANYAISGDDSSSYHIFNLLVHLAAGVLIFGIIRRTLLTQRLCRLFGDIATSLAMLAAVLWEVHPLQTESVAYIIQRAESMMGMFLLLTLYCVIRAGAAPVGRRPLSWSLAAVAACALGMGCKQVMVVAPLVVLTYDRIFLASSFREVFARRGWVYALLAATWLILAWMLWTQPAAETAGFGKVAGVSWLQYAATQPLVILYYLRLSVWPAPLCIDYSDWGLANSPWEIWPAAAAIAMLAGLTVWSMRGLKDPASVRPAAGFAGVWFFLILAPTSSIMPIKDLVFEHRMYLPLAAVVVLAALLASAACRKAMRKWARTPGEGRAGTMPVHMVGGAVALAFVFMTAVRCTDYFSDFTLWKDAVGKRPQNGRAHFGLGNAYLAAGNYPAAVGEFNEALSRSPELFQAWNNRGLAYLNLGRADEAIQDFDQSLRRRPDFPNAYCNRGRALISKGDAGGAIVEYDKAVRLDPKCINAYGLRAGAYLALRKYPESWADVRTLQRLGATPEKAFVEELIRASWTPGP